jgi:hypothetical protein
MSSEAIGLVSLSESGSLFIAIELNRMAQRLTGDLDTRLAALDEEEAELDARKAEIEIERNSINDGPTRAFNYRTQIGAYFQCPTCWITNEKHSVLLPFESKKPFEDLLRCQTCSLEVTVPA